MTQSEIGKQLGVSQMQISRISRRALGKLLSAVQGEPEGDALLRPSTGGCRSATMRAPTAGF